MSDYIERDGRHLLPGGAADWPEPRIGGMRPTSLLNLLHSVRRHWVLVLVVWILVSVPATLGIWHKVKPTYTASADVEVTPVQAAILYKDELSPTGFFDTYLNTQARKVSSNAVVLAALADPSLQGSPLLAGEHPEEALKAAILVSPLPKTNFLRVSVKQDTPEDAIRLARAVMKAYQAYAVDSDARVLEDSKAILRERGDRLAAELKLKQGAIAKLAARYGAASEAMFTALRDGVVRASVQTAGELERARIEKLRLQSQLEQLERDVVPTSTPAEDFVRKEQWVETDLVVKKLREEIAQEAWYLLRYGENSIHRKRKAALEKQLEDLKKEVAAEADLRTQEHRDAVLKDAKLRTREQLAVADRLVDTLQASYDAQKKEEQEMGRVALEIQQLQGDAKSTTDGLERVEERLRQLDIEGRRPARISVSVEPEILPDGIKDRRRKMMPLAVVGALCLGMFCALLKDLIAGRLQTMDEVEDALNLRLLGSLPSLRDLRNGRVSGEDFRESFRAIHATLAGGEPGGRIPRTILITSAQAAEGKTSLAVNLAAGLAEGGCHVLLIDGDVQAPSVGKMLKLDSPCGLRHVLLGQRQLAEAVHLTPITGLDVLLAGTNGQSAQGMLTNRLAARLLKETGERYDHVIIDSPPVLGAADALIWAQAADGVVLSSFAGHSTLRLVRYTCRRIAAVGGKILGAVICNVSVRENYSSYSGSVSGCSRRLGVDESSASSGRTPGVQLPDDVLDSRPTPTKRG